MSKIDEKIQEIIEQYKLRKEEDLWWHKQSKRWIIRHLVLQEIFDRRGLRFPVPTQVWSGAGYHRHIQICEAKTGEDRWEQMSWAIGEATDATCAIGYLGVMASYRGIALSGKRALNWSGILYSEHEAEWDRIGGKPPREQRTPKRGEDSKRGNGHGNGEPARDSRYGPIQWQSSDDIKKSVMGGDPPAFTQRQIAKWPYKSGAYKGLTWDAAYVEDFRQHASTNHLETQLRIGFEELDGGGLTDWQVKRLHTLAWILCRMDPKTGNVVAPENAIYPESWKQPSSGGEDSEEKNSPEEW